MEDWKCWRRRRKQVFRAVHCGRVALAAFDGVPQILQQITTTRSCCGEEKLASGGLEGLIFPYYGSVSRDLHQGFPLRSNRTISRLDFSRLEWALIYLTFIGLTGARCSNCFFFAAIFTTKISWALAKRASIVIFRPVFHLQSGHKILREIRQEVNNRTSTILEMQSGANVCDAWDSISKVLEFKRNSQGHITARFNTVCYSLRRYRIRN